METSYLDLVPPLFQTGLLDEFLQSGQTAEFCLSSRSNSLVVYPSSIQFHRPSVDQTLEPDIYVAALNQPPIGERRTFVSDTSLIFSSVLNYMKRHRTAEANGLRTPKDIAVFRKLANDYIIHIQDCWIHSMRSTLDNDEVPQYTGDHYRFLYSAFSLFQLLYLPEEGIDDVPVGDELLEWLNTHFIEPSTEEGDRLSGLERPWEDDLFWPYLIRATMRCLLKSSTFFFQSLTNHPSKNLQLIAEKLVDILQKHPRQRNFTTEREFFTTSRRWRDRVKALRIELDRVPEDDRNDGFESWWENISDVLGILEGREDVLRRVCIDLGGSWKEIICVYGIWADVGLRRSDLPEIVENILYDSPPDPTDKEDALHLELVQGRPMQALAIAHHLDPWLSAHLVDIMTSVGLLDAEADDETGLSIRDYYVQSYAEYLHSDPGLWRLTVDYLFTCGAVGREMADEILIRVPLELDGIQNFKGKHQDGNQSISMDTEGEAQDQGGDLSSTIKDLSRTCYEYQREHARRLVCQIAARKLIKLKQYGLAVSYCRSAEDWTMLGHIVETVLEEFVTEGPSRYVSLVSDIAPSLPELRVESGPHSIFIHRLRFAVRYAEFHQRKIRGDLENAFLDLVSIFEEDLAPRAWWAVLLHDATSFLENDRERESVISSDAAGLLLTRLEEVLLRASQGSGDDYLGILARILKLSGTQEALNRLDSLRLALARYLARCTLAGPVAPSGPSAHEL